MDAEAFVNQHCNFADASMTGELVQSNISQPGPAASEQQQVPVGAAHHRQVQSAHLQPEIPGQPQQHGYNDGQLGHDQQQQLHSYHQRNLDMGQIQI